VNDERTLLLIGARGFAGTHVRESAEGAGMRVFGASRDARPPDLACDLLNPASVESALDAAGPDLVVNMAGVASVGGSWRQPAETFAVNAVGVLNLLEAIATRTPHAHLLCVSSAEVYGEVEPTQLPLTEEDPLRPVSPYGSSKAAMELLCGQYTRSHGVRVAVVRAFNQLGPGQSETFVAAGFARQIAAAELRDEDEVTLTVGNLSVARDFIDIRDAAGAYAAIAERELTGTYNLCSGTAVKIETLVDHMRSATMLEVRAVPDPELSRRIDPPLVYGSAERLSAAIGGWQLQIPLERSVVDLLDSWRMKLRRAGAGVTRSAEA
jgi:GDP-4-dehydro-6-deoxy-D-mannose reductase